MTAILALIAQILPLAIQAFPTVIKTVEDLRPFATQLFTTFSGGKEITPEQQGALEALLADLSSQLQQPLPPE